MGFSYTYEERVDMGAFLMTCFEDGSQKFAALVLNVSKNIFPRRVGVLLLSIFSFPCEAPQLVTDHPLSILLSV